MTVPVAPSAADPAAIEPIVTVGVADPQAVLARVGPIARLPMRTNVRLCGTPVTLPVNTLPFTADELIRAIAAYAPTPPRAPWGNG